MAIRLDRFTVKAQDAVQSAVELASASHHPEVQPLHLLASLLAESDGVIKTLLQKIGANQGQLAAAVSEELQKLPKALGTNSAPAFASSSTRLLDQAQTIAAGMQDQFTSTEHLLLALSQSAGVPQRILERQRISPADILTALKSIRGSQTVTDQNPEEKYQALEKYGRNLVVQAQLGRIDPVIGRDNEIRRVIQILSRRRKNNPVLIGEAGVGKTALVEVLARQLAHEDQPPRLQRIRLV